MKRVLLPVLLLLVFAMAGTSLAFDCAGAPEKENFRRADLVFEGELVRGGRDDDEHVTYTFRVHKLLKGSPANEVTIISNYSSCGAHFLPDVVYRVYAQRFQGKLATGACSGNTVLKNKKRPRH